MCSWNCWIKKMLHQGQREWVFLRVSLCLRTGQLSGVCQCSDNDVMSASIGSVLLCHRWSCSVTMKFPFRLKDIFGGSVIRVMSVVFIVNWTVECHLIGSSNSLGDGCDWTGRWVVSQLLLIVVCVLYEPCVTLYVYLVGLLAIFRVRIWLGLATDVGGRVVDVENEFLLTLFLWGATWFWFINAGRVCLLIYVVYFMSSSPQYELVTVHTRHVNLPARGPYVARLKSSSGCPRNLSKQIANTAKDWW